VAERIRGIPREGLIRVSAQHSQDGRQSKNFPSTSPRTRLSATGVVFAGPRFLFLAPWQREATQANQWSFSSGHPHTVYRLGSALVLSFGGVWCSRPHILKPAPRLALLHDRKIPIIQLEADSRVVRKLGALALKRLDRSGSERRRGGSVGGVTKEWLD
jgi:hypothetical protein